MASMTEKENRKNCSSKLYDKVNAATGEFKFYIRQSGTATVKNPKDRHVHCDSGLESTEMQELLFTSLTVIFLKTWTVHLLYSNVYQQQLYLELTAAH